MGNQTNATICGHLAVLALFVANIHSGGALCAIGAVMAPAAWWLAQLAEAGIVPAGPAYVASVASQIFAAVTFLNGEGVI